MIACSKEKELKEEDREEEEGDRNDREGNRRSKEGPGEDLQASAEGDRMYEEECLELLKELASLSSKESSLHFQLYQLYQEAKVETIRLGGLISSCSYYDQKTAEELSRELDVFLKNM